MWAGPARFLSCSIVRTVARGRSSRVLAAFLFDFSRFFVLQVTAATLRSLSAAVAAPRMDGATRLAVLVDAACLAPDGTPLSGAWAVWRAVTVMLGALPPDGRWSLRLFGQVCSRFAVLHLGATA